MKSNQVRRYLLDVGEPGAQSLLRPCGGTYHHFGSESTHRGLRCEPAQNPSNGAIGMHQDAYFDVPVDDAGNHERVNGLCHLSADIRA